MDKAQLAAAVALQACGVALPVGGKLGSRALLSPLLLNLSSELFNVLMPFGPFNVVPLRI